MSTTFNSTNPPASLLAQRPSLPSKKPLDAIAKKTAPRRRKSVLVWSLLGGAVLGLAACSVWHWVVPHGNQGSEVLATATRGELPVVVTEKGDLESTDTQEMRCPVEIEQIKIVELKPEGTHVKKDETVLSLDKDHLERRRLEQEVKWKLAYGKREAAKQDLEVNTNKTDKDVADTSSTVTCPAPDI